MPQQLSTSETNLAAYLLVKNYPLLKLERSNPKRVEFVFSDVPKVAIEDFWANGKVGVMDFINAQHELKRRLFTDSF